MEKTSFMLQIFIFHFLIIHSFLLIDSKTSAKTQTDVLTELYKEKFKSNSAIDKSHINLDDHPVILDEQILDQQGLKEKDEIIKLPGQGQYSNNVKFKQYGGYVTVNQTAGSAFFYYFVEAAPASSSQYHVNNDLPLVLWLNGGPGCSSLGYGAFSELGPFRVHSDGKTLYPNTYAWNNAANILFLESPAGVGYSYSNNSNDYLTRGDKNTAVDNLVFLVNWLERFPEYKNRDFYLAGESYAGHYVPQLAHNILHHNQRKDNSDINLKGILIGNAVINDETDNLGTYDFLACHALISDETINQIHKNCNFSATASSDACNNAMRKADKETGNIDIYNIYAPLCHNTNLTAKPKETSTVIDPCSDYYNSAYLNRADVQEALHANVTKLSHDWEPCSDTLKAWVDSAPVILPLLREFLAKGLRVWVFSGDVDGRVPVTSTRYSLNVMKLQVTSPWRPWNYQNEVGGYTEGYATNLTFATVRGSGHQVPSYQGERALVLFQYFLAGKNLPV